MPNSVKLAHSSLKGCYPFGMVMPGRSFSSPSYRYGFNDKEKDDEVKNFDGAQYDYGFRVYDPRLGRFLSVDPITKSYPELTPYQFASNCPIECIDIDGLEGLSVNEWVSSEVGAPTVVPWTVTTTGQTNNVNYSVSISADKVNAELKAQGYSQPPYQSGTTVQRFTNSSNQTYIRLIYKTEGPYTTNSPLGEWVVKAEDIHGLTPAQIQDKLALPGTPTGYVKIAPGNAPMETGTAGKNSMGSGGLQQYRILVERSESMLITSEPIPIQNVFTMETVPALSPNGSASETTLNLRTPASGRAPSISDAPRPVVYAPQSPRIPAYDHGPGGGGGGLIKDDDVVE